MKKEDETIEKLLTIEKAINEMVALRQRILELKESETQRQMTMEALCASEKQYRILMDGKSGNLKIQYTYAPDPAGKRVSKFEDRTDLPTDVLE